MKVFNLLEFAAQMRAVDEDLEVLGPKIVEQACKIIQKKAKAAIGREHELWAPLADSTIKDKQNHGFPTPKPLLRTGELRDSIEYEVHGNKGAVGSNLDIAVYQELGTAKIPPRSFLVSSAIASEDRIHKLVGAAAIAALSGHAHHVSELLHALHRAGHALREAGHEWTKSDEDE
jgi:hypothetical protein